jgi:hypothetical protein
MSNKRATRTTELHAESSSAAGAIPREVRYNLAEMLAELPADRSWLKLGHELIGQDEIGRAFKLRKGSRGKQVQ